MRYPYLVWRQTGVEGGEGGIMIWGVKKGGTWRTVRVLIRDMEDRVIPDITNDVFLP